MSSPMLTLCSALLPLLLLLHSGCHAQLSLHTDANTNSFTLKAPGLQQSFTRYYGAAKTQPQQEALQQQPQQQPQQEQQQEQQLVSCMCGRVCGRLGIYCLKQVAATTTTTSQRWPHGITKAQFHVIAHLLAKHLDALLIASRSAGLHQLLNLCRSQHQPGAQILQRMMGELLGVHSARCVSLLTCGLAAMHEASSNRV